MRAFGIIGGGALLAFASAGFGGLGLLGPVAGVGVLGNIHTTLPYIYIIITGALGIGGSMVAQSMCLGPLYCTTVQGQCCLLVNSLSGLLCPTFC